MLRYDLHRCRDHLYRHKSRLLLYRLARKNFPYMSHPYIYCHQDNSGLWHFSHQLLKNIWNLLSNNSSLPKVNDCMLCTMLSVILLVVPLMQTESPDEQLMDLPYPSLHSLPPPVGKQCQHFNDVTKTTQICMFMFIIFFKL